MTAGPLDGIKVIDFTLAMAGPFATQKMGDLGAEIIKVEPTGSGEWHRTVAAANAWGEKHNSSFLAFNRNKTSLSIDLKSEKSKEIIRKLVEKADVVIQNFRVGVAERLGIDYDTLKEINNKIIYCSMSGYGETGPYSKKSGQDLILQGMSGATWNIGMSEDPPQPIAVFAADATGAHMALEGVLAALLHRERTGEGQKVEVNLLNGIVDIQAQELSVYFTTGLANRRTEEPLAHTLIAAPYGFYKTKDDYITLSMAAIPVLGEALDKERLKSMDSPDAGFVYRDEIYRIVSDILPTKTTEEWLRIFDEHNIWSGPVYDYDQLVKDPQVIHNEMVVDIDHPIEGSIRATGIPIKFSKTPGKIRYHQPSVGEHTEEILRDLGYSNQDIAKLSEEGVVYREEN